MSGLARNHVQLLPRSTGLAEGPARASSQIRLKAHGERKAFDGRAGHVVPSIAAASLQQFQAATALEKITPEKVLGAFAGSANC